MFRNWLVLLALLWENVDFLVLIWDFLCVYLEKVDSFVCFFGRKWVQRACSLDIFEE